MTDRDYRGIHAKKRYGQNFLRDEVILDEIIAAADITGEDRVLEIGPGPGALTERLCEAAKAVMAVEIDPDMIELLRMRLKAREELTIIRGDILEMDPTVIEDFAGDRRLIVAANLPYYITTPIIMYLLEGPLWERLSRIIIMVQREVADRLAASCGSRDYGAITVAVQYRCSVDIVTEVSRDAFVPAPNVDSAVVALTKREAPLVDISDEKWFFDVVKAAFAVRRKTLVNALAQAGYESRDKSRLSKITAAAGLGERVRGEELSIEQFAALAELLHRDEKV